MSFFAIFPAALLLLAQDVQITREGSEWVNSDGVHTVQISQTRALRITTYAELLDHHGEPGRGLG